MRIAPPPIPLLTVASHSKYLDTSYAIEARKQLGTHGLTPPNVESYGLQAQRCKSLPRLLLVKRVILISASRPQTAAI